MSPPSPISPRRKKKKIHLKKSNRDGEKKNTIGMSSDKYSMEPRIGKGGSTRLRKNSHGQYQSTLNNSQSSGQNSSILSSDQEDDNGNKTDKVYPKATPKK